MPPLKSIQATIDLKLFKVAGTWEPDDPERRAAWELYIELVTRVGVVELRDGLSREALSSIYSIFGRTREILREHGPSVARAKGPGEISFGYLAVGLLNNVLRPFLSYWHPELAEWEARRAESDSMKGHERRWERDLELRSDLARLGVDLRAFVNLLADACDVPKPVQLPGVQ